jgi:hypothetical protein
LEYCDLEKDGGKAKSHEELLPRRDQIQNALLRFMIRCLAGELKEKEYLAPYIIYKYDIWDEQVQDDEY